MTAADFWLWSLAIAAFGALLFLVLLNPRVTTPPPAVLDAVVEGALSLFAETEDVCPQCGGPGKLLGRSAHREWRYCPTCLGNPWPARTPDAEPPSQVIAC